jgi:hypothetical protein
MGLHCVLHVVQVRIDLCQHSELLLVSGRSWLVQADRDD